MAATASSFERLGGGEDDLGHSFGSSVVSAELFSMRWTTLLTEDHDGGDDDFDFDFGTPCADAAHCSSPLLVGAVRIFSDEQAPAGIVAAASSSPLFHSALSTPASVIATTASSRRAGRAPALMVTRRILVRYLRFVVPLCRKVRRSLRLSPRSRGGASLAASSTTTSPARRSTSSSYASAADQHWCHGNADTAVRDAILYCKKSIGQDM
uniref:Membrane-associated kinase regulator 6 n=1 Tax=Leersia perrieri TaxID=77586 RepID=A0A0D9XLV4_9ORYZ